MTINKLCQSRERSSMSKLFYDYVPFCQMAQRNLPTKHESERKGLNSRKCLRGRSKYSEIFYF